MTHLSQLATILGTLTGYTIISYPARQPHDGYYLAPNAKKFVEHDHLDTEFFYLVCHFTSLAAMETAVKKILNTSSFRPEGYAFATAGQPLFMDVVKSQKDWDDTQNYGVFIIDARWALD